VKPIEHLQDLTPDPVNANLGTPRGMGMLETSLERCGAGRSILVDKNGLVIAGNKTLEAAAEKGFGIVVVESDGKDLTVVQRTDLDLHDKGIARELAYLDNRVAELDLRWDVTKIMEDLDRGVPMNVAFADAELERLLNLSPPPEAPAAKSTGPSAFVLVFTSEAALKRFRRFQERLLEWFPEESSEGARLVRFVMERA
jgi:hypothetical protein